MTEKGLTKQHGFTLIEMLIVVIVLGILAAIIIPQITVSTGDAKLNTLKTNLNGIRKAIEHYYFDHNSNYPGDAVPSTKPADVTNKRQTFIAQLVRYTDVNGNISNTKTAVFKFGPYIKGGKLPSNPYNGKNKARIDNTEVDITVRDSSATDNGYKFYTKTGVFIAADGTAGVHDDL